MKYHERRKLRRGVRRFERFVIHHSPTPVARFVIRHSDAFTLIELVVVFGLILVLTGLVLSTVGYARKKGARARAETEIAAMSAACESYKADNAVYPEAVQTTNTLDAQNVLDPQRIIRRLVALPVTDDNYAGDRLDR